MLIEVINKGSNDNNSSRAVLCEILFSFMLQKYIFCDACGLRSPSFESSSVLYIIPTFTSSMLELIMQGMQQNLEKSYFRCKKNTWHVESNYILQSPIIVVNRFGNINNNFTKGRCSIPMDMTVVLGHHKFSLHASIDHHGPSMCSGHYTTSINCCKKKTFFATTAKLRSLKWLMPKTPLLLLWWCIHWLRNVFWIRTGGWEFWLLPWHRHILSIPLEAGRGISAETCGMDDVFPPDDLGSGPYTPFIIYIPYIIAAL